MEYCERDFEKTNKKRNLCKSKEKKSKSKKFFFWKNKKFLYRPGTFFEMSTTQSPQKDTRKIYTDKMKNNRKYEYFQKWGQIDRGNKKFSKTHKTHISFFCINFLYQFSYF